MIIQRVICDKYNRSSERQEATCDYNVSSPVIDSADKFRVQVETAEVNLTTMPLDFDSHYLINIVMPENTGSLVVGDNISILPKVILSVDHFISELNKVFNPSLSFSLGIFRVQDDGLITLVQDATSLACWELVTEVNLGMFLYQILNFLCVSPEKRTHTVNGIDFEFRSINKDCVSETKTQKIPTLNKLVKFKSVRFMTDLPVRQTKTYQQTINQPKDVSILTTIKINSANFDLMNQNNLLYIPNEIREVELVSNAPITDFRIFIEIYYSNGYLHRHLLAPGEYFEISLNFREYYKF